MLLGLGTDIIEISRIEKALKNDSFRDRVYTSKEIAEAEKKEINKFSTYAGKFCAKEAISKALGTGVREFNLVDMEILSDELGKPRVYFYGSLKEKMLNKYVEISISHCREYATAVAVVMKGENK